MGKLNVDLEPALKELEMATKKSLIGGSGIAGKYRSYFKGKGLEFEGYRAYSASDDSRLIDWKASLRAGETLVKEFMEGRNLTVLLLIDVGSSMVFGSTQKLKCEYAAEVGATLMYVSLAADDNAGFALFGEKIVKKVPPERGNQQFYLYTREIVNSDHYGGSFDLNSAIKFLMGFLKQGSLVIIISDFLGLRGAWKENLRLANSKYEVVGIMLRDPRDLELPDDAGQIVLADPHSERQILVDTKKVKKRYEMDVKQRLKEIEEVFVSSGADFIMLRTDQPFANPLRKFFEWRRSRWK